MGDRCLYEAADFHRSQAESFDPCVKRKDLHKMRQSVASHARILTCGRPRNEVFSRTILAISAMVFLFAARAVWASCTPSVSAAVIAADHVQITGGASGPCGHSAMTLYIDGHYVGQGSSDNPSFAGLFNLTDCFAPGQHTASLYATCNTNDEQSCPENGHVPHGLDSQFSIPETTVTVDQATVDENNMLHLVVGYVIPLDNHVRTVTVYENGHQLGYADVTTRSGSVPFDIDLSCRTEGTYDFGVSAAGCGQIAYTPVPVGVKYDPETTLNVVPGDFHSDAVIKYKLKGTSDSNLRSVSLQRLPLNKNGGSPVLLHTFTGLDASGTLTYPVTPTDELQILYALGSVCQAKDDSVALVPPLCSSCPAPSAVGDPVSLHTGNMRYSDGEPLPDLGRGPLRRTYDSGNNEPGYFGHGWTSLLDGWIRLYPVFGSRGVAVVGTEGNDRAIFSNITGTWRQIWPLQNQVRSTFDYDLSGAAVWTDLAERKVWTFAPGGGLRSVRSLTDGREWTIVRDASGDPTRVTDSWGTASWIITVDHGRHLVTSVGIEGRDDLTWTYQYEVTDDLTSVLAPDNAVWRTYHYTNHLMTDARDSLGHLIESHTYDSNGAAISSVGPSGEISSVAINSSGRSSFERSTTVTWRSGRVGTYYSRAIGGTRRVVEVHNGCSSCSGETAIYVYDSAGNLLRSQDGRGYVDVSTYDDRNRLTLITRHLRPSGCDPATSSTSCVLTTDALATATLATTPATVSEQRVYGNPNWPDRPTQVMTDSIYGAGAFGRVETFTYDAVTGEALVHTIGGKTGSPAVSEIHTITAALYDGTETAAFDVCGGVCAFTSAMQSLPQPRGRRKAVDGPRTDVADITQWVYYPNDAGVPASFRGRLAATREANGLTTYYEDYDVFGNARRVVDPNGVATERTYDALGRLLTSTVKAVSDCDTDSDPLCDTDITTSRTYSSGGGPLATESRPMGGVTSYVYDGRRRMQSLTRTVSATLSERIEYDYDPGSGKRSVERFRDNRTGDWVTRRSESYHYDQDDRLSQRIHADSATVTYSYDPSGNILSVKDENHVAGNTHYAYDAAGRLQSVTQTLAGVTGNAITTAYAYDLHGNLTSVTDPNGNVTSYVYDDFGRVLSQTSAVTGTTTYSYDPAGNLLTTSSANGSTTVRTYDELGRVTEADSTGGSGPESVLWQYDSPDQQFGLGRLTLMSDPSGETAYDYDRMGRIVREGLPGGGSEKGSGPITYAYDSDGNLSALGYPSGNRLQYTSDLAGRPIGVTREKQMAISGSRSVPLVSRVEYLPFGPLTKVDFGNGTTREATYDQRYRITANTLHNANGALADYRYALDNAGNITGMNDAVAASYNRTFGYDDLNRLTSSTTGTSLWGNATYVYDRMGNMKSFNVGSRAGSFTYSGSTSKVATVTEGGVTSTLDYDPAGNELHGGSQSVFTYSSRNLLESDGTNVYTYDGRGVRRTARTLSLAIQPSDQPVQSYWYSTNLHLLAEATKHMGGSGAFNASGTSEFVWMGNLPIAQFDASGATPTLRYTFTDHLGTPIIQTDATGAIAWRAEYEPYGRIHAIRAGANLYQPLRLPGQEGREGSEYYNIFRWYRSGWGRYTQSDPIGLNGGANLYQYATENPLSFFDPRGLSVIHAPTGTIHGVNQQVLDSRCQMRNGAVSGGGCTPTLYATATCTCSCQGTSWVPETTVTAHYDMYIFNGIWPLFLRSRKPRDPSVHDYNSAVAHEFGWHNDPASAALKRILDAMETPQPSQAACDSQCVTLVVTANREYNRLKNLTQTIEEGGGDPSAGGVQ
jgi:RHS repeat-associated protein